MIDQDQFAPVNGIEICYRHTGNQNGIPLLLIMGLGAQLIEVHVCVSKNRKAMYVFVKGKSKTCFVQPHNGGQDLWGIGQG